MYVSLQIIIKKYYLSNLYKALNGLIVIPLFNLYNNNINNNQALMSKFWGRLWILTNQSRLITYILSYCFIIIEIILLIKSLINMSMLCIYNILFATKEIRAKP